MALGLRCGHAGAWLRRARQDAQQYAAVARLRVVQRIRTDGLMIDHIGFPVSDYQRSKVFYLKALAPLDYGLVMEVTQEQTGRDPAAGFGADGKPDFWIGGEGGLDKPLHVAIVAKDRATVDAFYRAAIAAGGRDNGPPGIRAHYHPNYYGAFVLDPDGHNSRRSATSRREFHHGLAGTSLQARRYRFKPMERIMPTDNARNVGRVWDLMKKIGFAMLVTHDGDKVRARPMSAYLEHASNAIFFLTDARRHNDDEIAGNPNVNVSFADAAEQKYVSVTGTAVVSNDRAKIKQLFSTPAKAWWDSAEDPNIRVIRITPDDAEFWDTPGSVISYVKMAAAAMTGSRPDIGENRKVAM
jgi:general stress protein 26/catechol 2,3-dioxygenase-like lactoylglutathione lyase family enzyme